MSDNYLTTTDARTLGATLSALPGVSTLMAQSDAALAALLYAASIDIDQAMPYQGCKYAADQEREFPRYAHAMDRGQIRQPSESLGFPVHVWDWDTAENAAAVPHSVKLACLIQAASILTDPGLRARLEAIRSGLASQSIGSLSESYVAPTAIPDGLTGLCDRAQRLMERYRLRSGGLL